SRPDAQAAARQAALLGMWVFLATEVLFFGALFAVYAELRHAAPQAAAAASSHLYREVAIVNTALLLTSSYLVALAVHAARAGADARAARLLGRTAMLGIAFLALKGGEYAAEYHAAELPLPGLAVAAPGDAYARFVDLYIVMTGAHALHVAVGVGALLAARGWLRRGHSAGARRVEVVALYWHFVDIVWVFLFPLLYLVDR
ncbi:MAG: cytochrome c oxidase subunit 3, partial [Gammaproteobacteria bacterium]